MSQLCTYLTRMRRRHQTEYDPRAREVEKATLTAAAMGTSGGMGKEMDMLVNGQADSNEVMCQEG